MSLKSLTLICALSFSMNAVANEHGMPMAGHTEPAMSHPPVLRRCPPDIPAGTVARHILTDRYGALAIGGMECGAYINGSKILSITKVDINCVLARFLSKREAHLKGKSSGSKSFQLRCRASSRHRHAAAPPS